MSGTAGPRPGRVPKNWTEATVMLQPRCSQECEQGNHARCNHVLWAATSSDPNRANVTYCECQCHNVDYFDAQQSLLRMLKEHKRK